MKFGSQKIDEKTFCSAVELNILDTNYGTN